MSDTIFIIRHDNFAEFWSAAINMLLKFPQSLYSMDIDLEFDLFLIIFDNLSLEFIGYLFMIMHDLNPRLPSDEIAFASSKCFINKTRFFVEGQIVSANLM